MITGLLLFCAGLLVGIAFQQARFISPSQRWLRRIENHVWSIRNSIVEFEPGAEYDPDTPKGPNARISRANFIRRTSVRKLVRQYNQEEDANDPLGRDGK